MTTRYFEITEEEYETYSQKPRSKIRGFIEDKIPDYIKYGYGVYGWELIERDEKFYIEANCGSSCD